MKLCSFQGKPIDTPLQEEYLNSIQDIYSADLVAYNDILQIIQKWMAHDRYTSYTSVIAEIETVSYWLKTTPLLLRDLNAVLPDGVLVACSTDVEEVEFVVCVTPTEGRVLSTTPKGSIPNPSSTQQLRVVLPLKRDWDKIVIFCQENPQWSSCVSQLLQRELEDLCVDDTYKRLVSQRQIQLAKQASTLPPSLLLHNVSRVGGQVSGGGFADIYQGLIKDKPVCLKVLRLFAGDGDYKKKSKAFFREVLPWSRLSHPNVLPFLGANKTIFPSFTLISPWMKNGTLFAYLKKNPRHNKLSAVSEIVSGLAYLHGLEPPIIHRDIKAANILVTDDGHCMVGDFGLSSIVGSQRIESSSFAGEGSLRWQAPEVIDPPPGNQADSAAAADVYALGCTISEIYMGKVPFANLLDGTVIHNVMRGDKLELDSNKCGDDLKSLVLLCWEKNPNYRPAMVCIEQDLKRMGAVTSLLSPPPSPSPGHRLPSVFHPGLQELRPARVAERLTANTTILRLNPDALEFSPSRVHPTPAATNDCVAGRIKANTVVSQPDPNAPVFAPARVLPTPAATRANSCTNADPHRQRVTAGSVGPAVGFTPMSRHDGINSGAPSVVIDVARTAHVETSGHGKGQLLSPPDTPIRLNPNARPFDFLNRGSDTILR